MKSRQGSRPRERWGEVLLGGAAGLGAPAVLQGVARMLGAPRGGPAAVGWMAGLLGALVGGGLARRRLREAPELPRAEEGPREEAVAVEREPRPDELPAGGFPPIRRGPNGRERFWQGGEEPARTA